MYKSSKKQQKKKQKTAKNSKKTTNLSNFMLTDFFVLYVTFFFNGFSKRGKKTTRLCHLWNDTCMKLVPDILDTKVLKFMKKEKKMIEL